MDHCRNILSIRSAVTKQKPSLRRLAASLIKASISTVPLMYLGFNKKIIVTEAAEDIRIKVKLFIYKCKWLFRQEMT